MMTPIRSLDLSFDLERRRSLCGDGNACVVRSQKPPSDIVSRCKDARWSTKPCHYSRLFATMPSYPARPDPWLAISKTANAHSAR
jgi:hypothetical protein